MKRTLSFLVCLGLFATVGANAALAQTDKLWVSPLKAKENWRHTRITPLLTIEPGSPSSTALISASEARLGVGVDIPMTIPGNLLIWSVTVCYQSSDPASGIQQIRLTEMKTPDFALVKFDDGLGLFLNSTTPECHTSELLNDSQPYLPFRAQGTVTLALSLDFADPDHTIEIGGISINHQPVTVDIPRGPISGRIALRQNVPNPFAGSTMIAYDLPSAGPVELLVFDVAGRKVRTLEQGQKTAGSYQVVWDGRDDRGEQVAAGVYFYQARIGNQLGSKRMVLAR